jgi:hypothetical protein
MSIELPVRWKKHEELGKAKVENTEADGTGKPCERKSTLGILMVVDWIQESSRRDGTFSARLCGHSPRGGFFCL